jgi:hypothetical protein
MIFKGLTFTLLGIREAKERSLHRELLAIIQYKS